MTSFNTQNIFTISRQLFILNILFNNQNAELSESHLNFERFVKQFVAPGKYVKGIPEKDV